MNSRVAIRRLALGAALGLTLSTAALAQSYTAPGGIPPVTAPGGVEGRAAWPNIIDAQGGPRAYVPYGVVDDTVTGSLRPRRGRWDGYRPY